MSKPTANGTPFANLVLKNINKSLIISGHVDGSVHITGISDSILVINARQVRIHECKNVDIYLYCTSHPIIEGCSGMRFAPIPSCYVSSCPPAEIIAFTVVSWHHTNSALRSSVVRIQQRTNGIKSTTSSG